MIAPDAHMFEAKALKLPDRSMREDEYERYIQRFIDRYPRRVNDAGQKRVAAVFRKTIKTTHDLCRLDIEQERWMRHWKAIGWPRAAIPKPYNWLEMQTWRTE